MSKEIILSVVINGHGCEDFTRPWPPDTEISQFFKNNVRVYSVACVPDIDSLLSRNDEQLIMQNISNQFDLSERETKEVLDTFKESYRGSYVGEINTLEETQKDNPTIKNPDFHRAKQPVYLDRSSNLITYLSNKTYSFDDEISRSLFNGISVSDIRIKITDENGIVTYRPIRFPKHNFNMHNLIHKDGVETILETFQNKLDISRSLETIFEILGFDEDEDRLTRITLRQLFEFFKELNISYVNIFDLTCRACQTGKLDPVEIERIYDYESNFNEKPVAFGKRSDGKRSDGKRSDGKRSDGKQPNKKSLKRKRLTNKRRVSKRLKKRSRVKRHNVYKSKSKSKKSRTKL
jgi:hypothetical protein